MVFTQKDSSDELVVEGRAYEQFIFKDTRMAEEQEWDDVEAGRNDMLTRESVTEDVDSAVVVIASMDQKSQRERREKECTMWGRTNDEFSTKMNVIF